MLSKIKAFYLQLFFRTVLVIYVATRSNIKKTIANMIEFFENSLRLKQVWMFWVFKF